LASHTLGRRIRCNKLRILRLQLLKPVYQLVKLEVGDLRIIEHVVTVLVVTDLVAQLGNFSLDVFGHGVS
jgi:hypothetical protein